MADKPDDAPALSEIGDGEDLPGYWAEATTITVRRYTKQRLDDDRDGKPWDRYLEELRRSKADPLTLSGVDEIAERLNEQLGLDADLRDQLDRIESAASTAEERTGTIERKVDDLGGGR